MKDEMKRKRKRIIYEGHYLRGGLSIKNPTSVYSPFILHPSSLILYNPFISGEGGIGQ
jgi:hypothetical protein